MNKAEEFVFNICEKSFLSLWSYANPIGKKRKELCDVLVVCEPDVIIISVKNIKFKNTGNFETDWLRWKRKAVDESVKQLFGAERFLMNATHIIRNDGTQGIKVPKSGKRKIHRIAVALGGEGQGTIECGFFESRFVHVIDEKSFLIILNELNTISDFIHYLNEKENLIRSGVLTVVEGEENLLAFYINNEKAFPKNVDSVFIDNTLWEGFTNKEQYKSRLRLDRVSYVWDNLIEILCQDTLNGLLEFGPELSDSEMAIRAMAKEDRFSRRILGKSFWEFIKLSQENKVRSRMVPSLRNILYVFLATPHEVARKDRLAELGIRCFVALGVNQPIQTVIGIATERYEPNKKGFSLDLYYRHITEWTEDDQNKLIAMQKDFNFFSNPVYTRIREDEYPLG